jgi:tRNA G18 (ribose-2'-O)-methylase SpoU
VHVLAEHELAGLAGFPVHRGVLAAVHRPPGASPADVLREARSVAVLEDLNDPENLGALIRSAVALGIDGLLLSPRCTDPLYRRTVRVSMGEVLRLPWARLDPWPAALGGVRDAGFRLAGLCGDGALPLGRWAAAVGPEERVALLLGGEAGGLSAAARAQCTDTVRIPMRPGSDSLNVAAAAAIAFHAAGRLPG